MRFSTKILTVMVFCWSVWTLALDPSLLLAKPSSEQVRASPKSPWGDFTIVEETKRDPWWMHVLLWVPNRVRDLLDIVHLDVGVGPAWGGVVRLTKYGQFGYRDMSPASVRVGVFGRELPVLIERSNEFGVGPAFAQSKDRKVCGGEVGAGLDLLIVGAYGGVCLEEIVDFATGLFFIDVMDDDMPSHG